MQRGEVFLAFGVKVELKRSRLSPVMIKSIL